MSKEVEMPKFRTVFNKGNKTFHAPTGEKFEMRHEAEFDKWGKRKLVKTRRVNTYDIIQSHKDECNFEKIIRRAIEGDPNALNIMEGNYIDITDAPRTLMESQNMMLKAKADFEKLPKDMKQKFDYDYHNYMGMMFEQPEQFAEITGLKLKWEQEEQKKKDRVAWEETQKRAIENLANGNGISVKSTEKGEE